MPHISLVCRLQNSLLYGFSRRFPYFSSPYTVDLRLLCRIAETKDRRALALFPLTGQRRLAQGQQLPLHRRSGLSGGPEYEPSIVHKTRPQRVVLPVSVWLFPQRAPAVRVCPCSPQTLL